MIQNAKSIEAASAGAALVNRLRKGTKQEVEILYPETDESIILVPLNCNELQTAYAKAYERFRELKIEVNAMNADDFWSEVNLQIISLAMRDPSDLTRRKTLFKNSTEARKAMLPEERTAITSAYIALTDRANPSVGDMEEDLFDEITEYVKKKDVTQLSAFGSNILADFIITTVNRRSS